MAGLLSLLFAFFLSEALVTGCCDADLGPSSGAPSGLVASADPVDQTPAPESTPVCHCTHTTSVYRATLPHTVAVPPHHVAAIAVAPVIPPSHTLQPDSRPPIA